MFSEMHHSAGKGQSYLYFAEEDKWYDTAAQRINNVCVKALANPISEEEYQEQEEVYQPSEPTATPTLQPTDTPAPTEKSGTVNSQPSSTANSADDASGSSATGNGSGTADGSAGSSQTSGTATKKAKIIRASKYVLGKGEKLKLPRASSKWKKATLTFRSSNTKVAKVSGHGGVVKAKKTGTAKITVRAASGEKQTIRIRVKKAPKSLRLKAGKTILKKGKSTKIRVKLSKGSASYRLRYHSMNSKIATVSSKGKVKAKKAGTVRIRVKTFNDKKAYIKIKVVS